MIPAFPGEFESLMLGGKFHVHPPVVLAPMAGITNAPFRKMCQKEGAGLCVSEMIIAHLLVQGHKHTTKLATFEPGECPRSIQLYGIDAFTLGEATKFLVNTGVEHIDLNFGCPMKKITSKGGGAAVPENASNLFQLVNSCVTAAEAANVPVTVKMRMGLKSGKPNFLTAGMAAQDAGADWVALHARYAEEMYSPPAHWEAIAELVSHLEIPVLGNGDVFQCWDALRMMRQTGAAGVVIGRGCLGRPWLFRELADVFSGRLPESPPNLGQVLATALSHLKSLADWYGNEEKAVLQMRKLILQYLLGFSTSIDLEDNLMKTKSIQEWEAHLASIDYDKDEPYPLDAASAARLKGQKAI